MGFNSAFKGLKGILYKIGNALKYEISFYILYSDVLTLILPTWRIWWAPNNASKWQMGFNSAFKGL